MPAAIAALALLGGLFQPAAYEPGNHDVQVRHYHVSGWRLEVRRDRFDGRTVCWLERPHMVYANGVVTFSLGHAIDTANAQYRLDNGPDESVGSVAVEAAGLGAQFTTTNFENPTDGRVNIPLDQLGEAHRIWIKPNDKMAHRAFDLAGLSQAIEVAKGRGCEVT